MATITAPPGTAEGWFILKADGVSIGALKAEGCFEEMLADIREAYATATTEQAIAHAAHRGFVTSFRDCQCSQYLN